MEIWLSLSAGRKVRCKLPREDSLSTPVVVPGHTRSGSFLVVGLARAQNGLTGYGLVSFDAQVSRAEGVFPTSLPSALPVQAINTLVERYCPLTNLEPETCIHVL